MLGAADVVAFVASTDLARARRFYADILGLAVVTDDGFSLVLDAHGTPVRITKVESIQPAVYTILGWVVDDVSRTVAELSARGVEFTRFDGIPQDDDGVWTAPSGDRVAWFTDPDGNTLSLTQPDTDGR